VIGYTQYFTGLPAGLVWFHVAGSVAIWVTALFVPFTLRDRGSITDPAGNADGPQTTRGSPLSGQVRSR
jgi:heme A synthase